MTPLLHLVLLAIAALGWLALQRVNRAQGWFRRGLRTCEPPCASSCRPGSEAPREPAIGSRFID